jgi:YD repeat-containing protein
MMEYNGHHQILKARYRPTGGSSDPAVTYEYDSYGDRTAVIDELGHRKDYTYDAYRRQTSCIEQLTGPGASCTNVSWRGWDWIYDRVIDGSGSTFGMSAHTSKRLAHPDRARFQRRRVTARTFEFNNGITFEQTGVIQPLGVIGPSNPWHNGPATETHRFTYDENGQKSSYTDPRGRVTNYGYNNCNRLETTTEPKRASQPADPVTRLTYDAAGNKLTITFPDTTTQQSDAYDPFGQAWKLTDERHNVTDLVYKWRPMKKLQTVATYRQRDNPPGGQKRKRPTSITMEWDGRSRPFSRLTNISNVFSIIDYTYDDAGQVITESSTVVGSGASYGALNPAGTPTEAMRGDVFEYDKMGNRVGTHDIASRGATNFKRDDNKLTQYSSWTPVAINYDDDMGCSTYSSSFLWFGCDPLGRCGKRWMGSGTGNAQLEPGDVLLLRWARPGAGRQLRGEPGEFPGDGAITITMDKALHLLIREQYDYDAFGMPYFYKADGGTLGARAQWGNRFLITGGEWLQDLRIYDYRTRQISTRARPLPPVRSERVRRPRLQSVSLLSQ